MYNRITICNPTLVRWLYLKRYVYEVVSLYTIININNIKLIELKLLKINNKFKFRDLWRNSILTNYSITNICYIYKGNI